MPQGARNIGVVYPGLKPPERECSDRKCPWHSNISVRGSLLVGRVAKIRMHNTAVVEREYLVWVRKFKRYERRRSRIHVHNPPCVGAKEGDTVLIGETRPLSKSVSFVILGVLQRKGGE